mgnify:CR=1 FL=1
MKKIKLVNIKIFVLMCLILFFFELGVFLLSVSNNGDNKSISKLIEVLIIALIVTFISIIVSNILILRTNYLNAKETKELICFNIKTDLDILLNPKAKQRSDNDGKTIKCLVSGIKQRIKSFDVSNYHEFYFAVQKNKDFYSSSIWAASCIDKEHTFALNCIYFNLLALLEQYDKLYSYMPAYTIKSVLNYQHLNSYIELFIDSCLIFDQMKMKDYD